MVTIAVDILVSVSCGVPEVATEVATEAVAVALVAAAALVFVASPLIEADDNLEVIVVTGK